MTFCDGDRPASIAKLRALKVAISLSSRLCCSA